MYILALIDNDIGSCLHINCYSNKSALQREVFDILASVEPCGCEDADELKEYEEFDYIKEHRKFLNFNFANAYWESHFPGGHRYISVHEEDLKG